MRAVLTGLLCGVLATVTGAAPPRVFSEGDRPADPRLSALRNLNSYFPFKPIAEKKQWPARQAKIKRRILLSQGLWPMPSTPDLHAVIHGRVEREDYVVDRVFFESIPGHYVTGSLYRPKAKRGPFPAILSPHGHWSNGRFYEASDAQVRADLASGAERFEAAARFPIQARAVQLARMGCLVFVYDMTGNADSIQIGHRPDQWSHLDRDEGWGFFSAQAELRLQNMMGLQTWNSIRAIDFLLGLEDTDPSRIGVTGASGGGTQSMILAAIDDRITAAMPCVMVSTSMQGGCTCENAPYLRIDQGNVDIAAAIAPRPLGLTAADDWTVELETKGYPGLRQLYSDLGHKERLTAAFNIHFKHNYNHVNRGVMYGFFNRHFNLGYSEPVLEREFVPLGRDEATVWTDDFPAPQGDAVGDAHEVRLLAIAARDAEQQLESLVPGNADQVEEYRRVLGGAWETILGRTLDQVGEVSFEPTREIDVEDLRLSLGTLSHGGERVPTLELDKPSAGNKGTVIWITNQGKAGLFRKASVDPIVSDLAADGYTILSADLIGQGEATTNGEPLAKQPMWYQRDGELGWQRFSGYTYGYNHPLFVKRVHDVLTLIKYAERRGNKIFLVGIGKQAGPIAAAARAQAGTVLTQTFLDPDGFRFVSLEKQDDPMFVPGAVKYLDIDGLLSLGVPGTLNVVGPVSETVTRVAAASGASETIHWQADGEALLESIRTSLLN